MLLTIIREVAGCYLVLTLATTGLAKVRAWRSTAVGVVVEGLIPRSMALATTIAVCVVELALATLLASRELPRTAGFAMASLFLTFAVYKLAVVIRTGKVACSCTGTSTAYKATRPGILASISASLIQAALGCMWAVIPAGKESVFTLPILVALVVPVAAFAKGTYPGRSNDRIESARIHVHS